MVDHDELCLRLGDEMVTGPGSAVPKAAVPLDGCGCKAVTNAAATNNPEAMCAAGEDGDSKVGEGSVKRAPLDAEDGADHSATADLHQTCDTSDAPPANSRTEMRRPTAPDPMAAMDGSSVEGEEPAVVTDESSASSMDQNDGVEEQDDWGVQGYEIIVPQCRMKGGDGRAMVIPQNELDDNIDPDKRKGDSTSSGEDGKDDPAPSNDGDVPLCDSAAAAPVNSPTATAASGDKKAVAPLPPPQHVYALRDIAWPGCNLCREEGDENGEEGREESCRASKRHTHNHRLPRIVTSQAVWTSEAVHKQLEADTAGTVLCRPESRGGVGAVHFQAADVSSPLPEEKEDRERARESLSIAAVPSSSLRKEMERLLEGQFGTRVRCPFTCDDEEATTPGTQVGEKKRLRWRLLPRRLAGSLRHMMNRKDRKKKRSEGRSRHAPPSMVLEAGGVIDWAQSDLEDCRASPGGYSYVVTYTANRNAIASPVGRAVGLGTTIFGDRAVMGNRIDPIDEVVPVSASLGVYISESGLGAADCKTIIDVSERCAADRGGWSSYTYAKQTLGCREDDRLAFVCARPVMTACATIRKHLVEEGREAWPSATNNTTTTGQGRSEEEAATTKAPAELVLDVREPHVVKYDTTRVERGKLDLHTDKSVWTFLIALSEGRGQDYRGGGTYFQALNSVAHLQRGQMLVFRGRLRHSGVKIGAGCRYLLVGFLVPKGGGGTASRAVGGGGAGGGVKASPAEIRC